MCRGPEAVFRLRAFYATGVLAGSAQVFLLAALLGFLLAVPPVFRAPSGPPARSPSAPRASLGASARSPARPCCPAGALLTGGAWCVVPGHTHLSPVFAPRTAEHPINFACNSLATISNREFVALELQRFLTLLNLRSIELHATFGGGLAVRRCPPHWWLVVRGVWCVVPGRIILLPRAMHLFPWPCPSGLIGIGCAHLDRLCASG